MRRPLAAGLFLAGTLGACSTFVDWSAYSVGDAPGDGGAGSDAVGEANDTGAGDTEDAGADAPAAGDGAASDAGVDASDAAFLDAAGFCATQGANVFCDDFDSPGYLLPGPWDGIEGNGGFLGLDTSIQTSGTRSLLLHVTPFAGDNPHYLRKKLTVVGKKLRVSLRHRRHQASTTSLAEVDAVNVSLLPPPPGRASHDLGVATYTNGPFFEYFRVKASDPTMSDATDDPVTLPLDTWLHVVIGIDYTASPPKGSLEIDGTVVQTIDLEGTAFSQAEVQIGGTYLSDPNLDWTFNFDDVLVQSPF